MNNKIKELVKHFDEVDKECIQEIINEMINNGKLEVKESW